MWCGAAHIALCTKPRLRLFQSACLLRVGSTLNTRGHIFKINIDIPLQMSGECGKDHDAGLSGDDTDTEDDLQYMATTNQMYILVALLQQQPASRPRLEQHHDRHEASDAAENGVLFPAIGPKTFEESLAEMRMSHGGATRPRASRLQSSFQLP